jgi:enoyl-CoA hydratase/carnithine racemase
MDMVLTRRKVDAEEAVRIGLATHRAGVDDVISAAVTLARSIVDRPARSALLSNSIAIISRLTG